MKGSGVTYGHPFEEPFITYHRERAENGDYESARWLRDNVESARKAGQYVDPYLCFVVAQMKKGGLRKSRRMRKRGQRGKGDGDGRQLRLAVEMWKRINLAKVTTRTAQQIVSACYFCSTSEARNAYYRFAKPKNSADQQDFLVQLKIDYLDNPSDWEKKARDSEILKRALDALTSG